MGSIAKICVLAAWAMGMLLLGASADTDITLSGSYDHRAADGYQTTSGRSYLVSEAATFNGNRHDGLFARAGSTVTVTDGTFTGNHANGLESDGARVTVNAGAFTRNTQVGLSVNDADATVNNGLFTLSDVGVLISKGLLTVAGGGFTHDALGGVLASNAHVLIKSGAFVHNKVGLTAVSSHVVMGFGTFAHNGIGVAMQNSDLTLTGGAFQGNSECDLAATGRAASLTLIGKGLKFTVHPLGAPAGAPTGNITVTTPDDGRVFTGTVSGMLRDNGGPSRLTFKLLHGARITLSNVTSGPQ